MRNIRFTVNDARRWLSLFLVCCFIICGIGGIHQRAKAVVVVDDAIVAIVIAALAAMGITFTMTGGYQTVRDWIRDKITESGIDFSGVKYGASSVGSLLLNNVFVRRIAALATYIKAELGLIDNSTHQIYTPDIAVLDEISGQYFYPGTYTDAQTWTMGTLFFSVPIKAADSYNIANLYRFNGTYYRVSCFKEASHNMQWRIEKSTNGTDFEQVSYGRQGNSTTSRAEMSLLDMDGVIYFYLYATSTAQINMVEALVALQSNESLDAVTRTLAIPSDADIGTQGGILSLPVPWGQSMGTTLTDIPGLVLSDELAGNTTLELEDASAVEDQISDTATVEQPYVSSSASDYQSPGLSSVFPFCIPFDLYEFFECLAADPEAPEISWRFYVPGICDEQIEIDLSQFDTVAQIVRTMELLAFIVGLALVTREKFLRG